MVKKKELDLEESPLLSSKQRPSISSTINPKKLDRAKFTEIRQKERESGNPTRIVLFVVIIIVVGAGSALIVRNLATNNTSETNNQQQDTTPTPTVVPVNTALVINQGIQSDSSAINPPKDSDFVDSINVSAGEAIDPISFALNKIEYSNFQSFSRIKFDLANPEDKILKYNINFDSLKKIMNIQFEGILNLANGLKQDNTLNELVSEIRFDQVNNKHIFVFRESVKYRVFTSDGDLFLDLRSTSVTPTKTNTVSVTPTSTPQTTPTVLPTATQSEKPAAPFYENKFSTSKQFISSKVNSISIQHNTFYVDDVGSYFEFAFASRGNVGESFIPNAVGYWENKNNKDILVVEVENLSRTFMFDSQTPEYKGTITAQTLQNNIGVNTSNANFLSIKLRSYQNGKAIYEIETKRKADFKLVVKQVNISGVGNSQALAIQIMD